MITTCKCKPSSEHYTIIFAYMFHVEQYIGGRREIENVLLVHYPYTNASLLSGTLKEKNCNIVKVSC